MKSALNKISSTTICNDFIKADLQINCNIEANETNTQTKVDEVNVSELSELLKKLKISLTSEEFIDFIMMDDENSPEYIISAILEESSPFLEELEDSTADNQQVGEISGSSSASCSYKSASEDDTLSASSICVDYPGL